MIINNYSGRLIFQKIKERPFLALTVLLGFIPLIWFRPWDTLITGGDFWLPLGAAHTLRSLLSAWLPNVSGGQPNSIVYHAFPYFSFWSLLNFLGLPLTHVEKLWFVSLFLTAGVSIFFLVKEVFPNQKEGPANLVASAFYLFNLYIMMTGVVTTTLLSYCLTPLLLLIYIKGLKSKKKFKLAFFLALALSLLTSAAANPPIFLIPFLVLFLYFIYHLFLNGARAGAWRFHLYAAVLYLLFNSWWLFLFVKSLLLQVRDVQAITAAATVGAFSNFYDLVRLLGSWAFFAGHLGTPYFPFAQSYRHPVLMALTFIIPALALSGFFFHLKKFRSPVAFFTFLSLLGIFLSHGQGNDFLGGLYSAIKSWVPFFWIYREPFAKFTLLTALSYSFLLASFFIFLESVLPNRRVLYLLTLTMVALILTVAWPEVSGAHFPEARGVLAPLRTKIPDYWQKLADFFKGKENEGRVFILPDNPDWNRSGIPYAWGYDSADVGPHLLTVPWLERNNGFYGLPVTADRLAKLAFRVVDDRYAHPRDLATVWRLLNVKYLLQRNDVDLVRVGESADFYSPQHVKRILQSQRSVSLEKTFGALDVYKVGNEHVLPKVYGAQKVICVEGDVARLDYILDLEPVHETKAIIGRSTVSGSLCQEDYLIPAELFRQGKMIKSVTFKSDFSDSPSVYLDYGAQPFNFSGSEKNFGFVVDRESDYRIAFLGDEHSLAEKRQPDYRLSFLGEPYLTQIFAGAAVRSPNDETLVDLGTHHLAQGKYMVSVSLPIFNNFIENGSFEKGAWASSLQNFPIPTSPEALDGVAAMSLGKNITDVYQPLVNLDPGLLYQISFYYKVNEGSPPVFFIWENGCDYDRPVWRSYVSGTDNSCQSRFITGPALTAAKEWTKYEYEYHPSKAAQSRGLGLAFLDAEGKILVNQGETLIDDVNVGSKFYGGVVIRKVKTAEIRVVPQISILEQSSTFYKIKVTGAKEAYPLVFSESYSPDWQAVLVKDGRRESIPESQHFLANVYANAWSLSQSGDYEVEISYVPERTFRYLSGLALLSLAVSFLVLAVSERLQRRKNLAPPQTL